MATKMSTSKLSTPNITASEAILISAAEIKINAPAEIVFRALRNTDTWRDWNRWVPKVSINYQPPDNEATVQEVQELIRNTSIAGSFYSDLTDGGIGTPTPKRPDEQPPPRFRLNSVSSRSSIGSQPGRLSSDAAALGNGNRGSVSAKSGAQLFQETTDSRRNSVAAGEEPEPVRNVIQNTNAHRASIAFPPPSPESPRKGSKQKYTQTVGPTQRSVERAHAAMMSVYGEPSVRLQIKTKLTLGARMKPASPSDYTEFNVVVIDVARPDDPDALTRSMTHSVAKGGIYRVVWANNTDNTSILNVSALLKGINVPKSMLQAERVHEIEPTGPQSCIYRTWELQKGHAAKSAKKKNGEYLQKMFEVWCSGLRDFCEGLHAPKIDIRDFSISEEEAPSLAQIMA